MLIRHQLRDDVNSYNIRIRTTDKDGLFFEKPFTITIQERNLALNKPATSSGIEGALIAGQAVDGGTTSRWASSWSDDQWFQVDLGNVYSVTRVLLNWEAAYGKEYKIQTSLDATTWDDAAHITDGAVEVRSIPVSNKVCRYVRMRGIERGTNNGYSLWEFEVYGNLVPNVAPSDIALPNNQIVKNDPVGTVVGTLTSPDFNSGDIHTFTLVTGAGSTDNSKFTIDGDKLKINEVFPTAPVTFSVRIRVTDEGGLWTEKQINVYVSASANVNFPQLMYSIYSTEFTTINSNVVTSTGLVGSNGGIEVFENSHIADDCIAGTSLVLHDNTIVDGNAVAGTTVTASASTVVKGNTRQNTTHTAITILPRTVIAGSHNVTLASGTTTSVPPGDYADFYAFSNAKVQLSAGTYNFLSFQTEPDVQVECVLPDGDSVVINVLSYVGLRDRTKMYVTGQTKADSRAIRLYSNQSDYLMIHPNDNISAMITAPNAIVTICSFTAFTGAVYGRRVIIESNVSFDGSSSLLIDSDGDGVQDIIETLPQYGTNPNDKRSYPPIALVDPPVLSNSTDTQFVQYDFSPYSGGLYSCASDLVLTVNPNTIGQNEQPPIIKFTPTLSDGTLPTVPGYKLVGNMMSIDVSIMDGASLTIPIPLPCGSTTAGNDLIAILYNDGSAAPVSGDIVSRSGNAVDVKLPPSAPMPTPLPMRNSYIAIFEKLGAVNSKTFYVDGDAVYTEGSSLYNGVILQVNMEIRNSTVSTAVNQPNTAGVIVSYDKFTGTPSISTPAVKNFTIANLNVSTDYNYKTEQFIPLKINKIVGRLLVDDAQKIEITKVQYYSENDNIGSLAVPITKNITAGFGTVNIGECWFVFVVINQDQFNNTDPAIRDQYVSTYVDNLSLLEYYSIAGEGQQNPATSAPGSVLVNHFYVKDHLGSTRMTIDGKDANFTPEEITMYESYGVMDNILLHAPSASTRDKFTTKEFDQEGDINGAVGIGLFYFGVRYYDPEVGIWGSTDPKEQFWSAYKYTNNPINMVDPDGSFFGWGPVGDYMLFSDQGYDLQKKFSPVAFHINFGFGTDQSGICYDISIGTPTCSPVAYRRNFGQTYRSSFYDNSFSGWETRDGGQWSARVPTLWGTVSTLTFSGTRFKSGETSQITQQLELGSIMASVAFENDGIGAMINEGFGNALAKLPGVPTSEGDRWRTAAFKAEMGGFSIGLNLFTGDPGFDKWEREKLTYTGKDGKKYYDGYTADKYRAGVLYLGIGPIRIGKNSEAIRNKFQNEMIHDPRGIPRFTVLPRKSKSYIYFGNETGNTLW